MSTQNETLPTADEVPVERRVRPLVPERAALARLVAADEARQLLTLTKTFGGTMESVSADIERHHRAQRNAENEFCHAIVQAKRALEA